MPKYSNDPRWITARFGKCSHCKQELTGKRAFFYPLTKDIFCEKCGQKEASDFTSHVMDEDVFTNSSL